MILPAAIAVAAVGVALLASSRRALGGVGAHGGVALPAPSPQEQPPPTQQAVPAVGGVAPPSGGGLDIGGLTSGGIAAAAGAAVTAGGAFIGAAVQDAFFSQSHTTSRQISPIAGGVVGAGLFAAAGGTLGAAAVVAIPVAAITTAIVSYANYFESNYRDGKQKELRAEVDALVAEKKYEAAWELAMQREREGWNAMRFIVHGWPRLKPKEFAQEALPARIVMANGTAINPRDILNAAYAATQEQVDAERNSGRSKALFAWQLGDEWAREFERVTPWVNPGSFQRGDPDYVKPPLTLSDYDRINRELAEEGIKPVAIPKQLQPKSGTPPPVPVLPSAAPAKGGRVLTLVTRNQRSNIDLKLNRTGSKERP